MRNNDLNKVVFYSKEDLACMNQLKKAESILRSPIKEYSDVNEVLELYNIKQYLDNELFLVEWTEADIISFSQKSKLYEKVIGQFMSNINDNNILDIYENIMFDYIESFWEIINSQGFYKRISKSIFDTIISNESHIIHVILTKRKIVEYYNVELKKILLQYPEAAELLMSTYEVEDRFNRKEKFLPKSLTIQDKENILSKYLDSDNANLNYIDLIQNAKNTAGLRISDKTRLKAKRLYKKQTQKIFTGKQALRYGVTISFPENTKKVKDGYVENLNAYYFFSLEFIKKYNDPYSLFKNFEGLFEYVDEQKRIELVSKRSQIDVLEMLIGINSKNYYKNSDSFYISELTSQCYIQAYNKVLNELGNPLENVLHSIYTSVFKEKYNYADNARFIFPSFSNSFFEKVRLIAPEFESVLKQYKLFVEDGIIDFELLQMSSIPTGIKNIPSLNENKYIYFNEENSEMVRCANLFFSSQTGLAYVEPFKEKKYKNLFHLLSYEDIKYSNYEEYQQPQLNYLIERRLLFIDDKDFIQIKNFERVLILKDLYENEVASYYHYQINFQNEVKKMEEEKIVFFETTLFSKPEQSYFNYFLNKSEFTNGLDLRNSYLHGTQADPEDNEKHESTYLIYLKLVVLALLKMDDDLLISKALKESSIR